MDKIKNWVVENHDLAFAILLAICVYGYFALTNEYFATHRTGFAIMERFAVLGLVGLALTLCIIAGEIDLSIGSNAALAAVVVVRFTDSLGAFPALFIAVSISTLIGAIQGYFIAYLRVRAIVLTVGTLMLLRGVALFAAEEKTVMLTDFRVPDFISTKMLWYFSPASLLVIAMFVGEKVPTVRFPVMFVLPATCKREEGEVVPIPMLPSLLRNKSFSRAPPPSPRPVELTPIPPEKVAPA